MEERFLSNETTWHLTEQELELVSLRSRVRTADHCTNGLYFIKTTPIILKLYYYDNILLMFFIAVKLKFKMTCKKVFLLERHNTQPRVSG